MITVPAFLVARVGSRSAGCGSVGAFAQQKVGPFCALFSLRYWGVLLGIPVLFLFGSRGAVFDWDGRGWRWRAHPNWFGALHESKDGRGDRGVDMRATPNKRAPGQRRLRIPFEFSRPWPGVPERGR
jgi:hypothetical protein